MEEELEIDVEDTDALLDESKIIDAAGNVDNTVFETEEVITENDDELEAADMTFDKAKELTAQILPKYKKVVDPILGNVSEMYGVIINGDKKQLQDSSVLEELQKIN